MVNLNKNQLGCIEKKLFDWKLIEQVYENKGFLTYNKFKENMQQVLF